jgi:hypothetical protein
MGFLNCVLVDMRAFGYIKRIRHDFVACDLFLKTINGHQSYKIQDGDGKFLSMSISSSMKFVGMNAKYIKRARDYYP